MNLINNLLAVTVILFSSIVFSGDSEQQAKAPVFKLDVTNQVVEVKIINYSFEPKVVEISIGQTIKWINQEKRQYHSIWFEKNGELESDYLFPGDVYQKIFNGVGNFDYRCGPHPEMTGIVKVK